MDGLVVCAWCVLRGSYMIGERKRVTRTFVNPTDLRPAGSHELMVVSVVVVHSGSSQSYMWRRGWEMDSHFFFGARFPDFFSTQ